jgi:malonate-semialdehyde dehydrogenase (acetylating)/methylmalonate-semialdehyde dehydrogenase
MNYFGGTWQASQSEEKLDIVNPATAKTIGKVPFSSPEEVDLAVNEASTSYGGGCLQQSASNSFSG